MHGFLRRTQHEPESRAKGLKVALVLFGTICFLIYPLAVI